MAGGTRHDYDVLVVGSGFGGSVTALRLAEKGYRVGVLEAGRRFADHEFAKTSWHVRDFLWAPALGCYGILRMTLLRNVFIVSGAGVGGGSLVYANTLYEAPEPFYADPQWAHITDWKAELAPYYDQARRMLGVATNPATTASDRVLREVARDLGVGDTYRRTPVGVLFGPTPDGAADPDGDIPPERLPGGQDVPDPYFGGAGPARRTCTHCGECMTGCRHGAKNTTVKNYLYLAERAGAVVHPLTTVRTVRPIDPADPGHGYRVDTVRTGGLAGLLPGGLASRLPGGLSGRGGRTFTAEQVVFSAAALGTQRLLHRMRDGAHLPRISPRLGELSRTNSETINGPRTRSAGADFSRGVAITSSIHPDPVTHIEPVRYGPGSNLLSLIASVLVDGGTGRPRWADALAELGRRWRDWPRMFSPRRWSEQAIVVLTMQTLDNSVTTFTRRGLLGRRMTTRQGIGQPNPDWIPAANDVTRRIAEKIDGIPMGSVTDLVNRPLTAHFIGGCPIGDSIATGVVDPYQRLFGYPGLHVVDGSAVSANLGVNPSLTITAQAERAMALWPNAGDADPRPPLGAGYVRLAPVPPRSPAVPEHAPAALRLPWPAVRAQGAPR